jgi:hypothetical protein
MSDRCYPTRKNPINGTPVFLYNPTISDDKNWTFLSWNPGSCETANSDYFLTSDYPESYRKRTDPEIGSDRFLMYGSGWNSMNPTSRYQRKTVDRIGIRQRVIDRIRLDLVWKWIKNIVLFCMCLICQSISSYIVDYFSVVFVHSSSILVFNRLNKGPWKGSDTHMKHNKSSGI